MRKFFCKWPLVIVAALMATQMTTVETQADTTTFTDIDQSYAASAIQDLASKGIVSGYSDGGFHPDDPVTRAEFTSMLLRAKRFPVSNEYSSLFRDVQRGEWFAPYVEQSYRLGITSGTEDGDWHPDSNLTREEMIQMTVCALGPESEAARHQDYDTYTNAVSPFADSGQILPWAVKSMAYAVRTGLVHGTPPGELLPQAPATRAEVAVLLDHAIVSPPHAQNQVPLNGDTLDYTSAQSLLATAYTATGAASYTGIQERVGVVAVDPSLIPLGSHLFIPGYGYAVAADEGGTIKQKRVDLFMNSNDDAIQFGMQNVTVYVLD